MDDNPIFKSRNIVVTKTLARFGRVTYPINGIGSVTIEAPPRAGYVIMGIASLGIAVWVSGPDSAGAPLIAFGVALVLFFMAWNAPYKLMLRTASGDQMAFKSQRWKSISAVKAAIETAITMRG